MSSATQASLANRAISEKVVKQPSSQMITVGKDVLELLSSAMYVDPLAIYREYVQNAADAIDEALLAEPGRVQIDIDQAERSIRIRDNGSGIAADKAAATLLSIGASAKRGTRARGFRGVGRLAGLAYCRQLTFRTRAKGDKRVTEVIWDCLKLKSTLQDVSQTDDLPTVMQRIVSIADVAGLDYPEHFFEVELNQVVRLRKDVLLNAPMVEAYLAQVAPVPFASDFSFAANINAHLAPHVRMANLEITLGPGGPPITRPHRDVFAVSETVRDRALDVELLTFDGGEGVMAVGWILHHGYLGHISAKSQIGGLRLRAGNIQVGDADLAEEIFPESRFNGWSVGEFHVVDSRLLPNARRDNFEQNVYFSDLINKLTPIGLAIARRCRAASVARHKQREIARDIAPDLNGSDADVSATDRAPTLSAAPQQTPDQAQPLGGILGSVALDNPTQNGESHFAEQPVVTEEILFEQLAEVLERAGLDRKIATRAFKRALHRAGL